MHEVAQRLTRVLWITLLVLLLAACGSGLDSAGPESGGQLSVQDGSGTPVDTEEAAIAAVRAHLSHITSCRTARDNLQQDFAEDSFDARLTSAYSIRSLSPVWEVGFAGDLHIPYVIWFVEQSDGTVLASISAATYYESPLIHMCHQI